MTKCLLSIIPADSWISFRAPILSNPSPTYSLFHSLADVFLNHETEISVSECVRVNICSIRPLWNGSFPQNANPAPDADTPTSHSAVCVWKNAVSRIRVSEYINSTSVWIWVAWCSGNLWKSANGRGRSPFSNCRDLFNGPCLSVIHSRICQTTERFVNTPTYLTRGAGSGTFYGYWGDERMDVQGSRCGRGGGADSLPGE